MGAGQYPFDKILSIIRSSLGDKENLINDKGKQKILQGFGVTRRKKSRSIRYKIEAETLFSINTGNIKKNSLGIGALRRDDTIFYDDYSLKIGEDDDKKLLKEMMMAEFGVLEEERRSPITATIIVSIAFFFGAIIAVFPFFFVNSTTTGIIIASIFSLIGLFAIGGGKAWAISGNINKSGLENLSLGAAGAI
ncbi:hypothetical protein LCGC14_1387180, partial [marine sediment metagenome]